MSDADLQWQPIASVADAQQRAPLIVTIRGVEVAVFRLPDGFCAIDNSCPHAGGSLAEGLVEGDAVECPWHGWSFDLRTGACRTVRTQPARTWPLRERDGMLEIGLAPE